MPTYLHATASNIPVQSKHYHQELCVSACISIMLCVLLQVAQTFYITIRPVDDSLPLLQVPGMRVQEGVRKTITEFELKATDADTEV